MKTGVMQVLMNPKELPSSEKQRSIYQSVVSSDGETLLWF